MPTVFRNGAILLTLIATVVLTAAHQIGSDPARLASPGPTPGMADATSSIDAARRVMG